MAVWAAYALSLVVSYLIQRWMLAIDSNWWANPMGLLFVFMLVPIFNVPISLIVLICVASDEGKFSFRGKFRPLRWFYGVHKRTE